MAARDATIMSAALQLRDAGQPGWATKLLGEVARPLLTAGWLSLARGQLANTPLVSTLRHSSGVQSAAFSANGGFVLTVSGEGDATLWRADGCGDPIVLRDHPAKVTSAAFSPDGALVVTGTDDGIARIWRVDGSAPPAVFQADNDAIEDISFSPDGQRFVTAGGTNARLWRIDQPSQSAVLPHDDNERVFAASFSPDSRQVVTRCTDGAARLWRADDRAFPSELRHPDSDGFLHPVNRIRVTRDGKFVVSRDNKWFITGSMDGTARVWSLDDPSSVVVLAGDGSGVHAVAFSADGRFAAAGFHDATVRVARLAEPRGVVIVPDASGLPDPISSVALSRDAQYLLAQSGGAARVWRLDCERSHGRTPRAS